MFFSGESVADNGAALVGRAVAVDAEDRNVDRSHGRASPRVAIAEGFQVLA